MTTITDEKKPRTAPPEVRRKQLIDATIICIARNCISGTTLAAIAKEAGLSMGLVSFHFKSKDILLSETLKYLTEEHRELWMQDALCDNLSAARKLRSIVDAQFHPRICSRKKLAVWFAFSAKRHTENPIVPLRLKSIWKGRKSALAFSQILLPKALTWAWMGRTLL